MIPRFNRTVEKIVFGICLLPTIFLVFIYGFFVIYNWDADKNRGFYFGYYGQFNQTQDAIKGMPGVTIIDSWQHRDISLEDFGFTIRTKTKKATINFYENSPQIKIRNKEEIQQFVLKELGSNMKIQSK